MGYETKLLIGISSPFSKQASDRKETYFQIFATLDLCKCGYPSKLHELPRVNTDENHCWFWYGGDEEQRENLYGEQLKPVPVRDVLEALKADMVQEPNYRRFKWARALLESMVDDQENLEVLLYGH
jgi:hypothetical protein